MREPVVSRCVGRDEVRGSRWRTSRAQRTRARCSPRRPGAGDRRLGVRAQRLRDRPRRRRRGRGRDRRRSAGREAAIAVVPEGRLVRPTPARATDARRVPGVAMAGATALVSGVSVFVNSYGVRAGATPAVYTTAKNLVAVVVLDLRRGRLVAASRREALGAVGELRRRSHRRSVPDRRRGEHGAQWLGLAYVGVVGGGLAFVLFFDGLAQSEPAPAAFWRDTLRALGRRARGALFLRERLRWWNVAAIALSWRRDRRERRRRPARRQPRRARRAGLERAVGGRGRRRQPPAAGRWRRRARRRAHGRGGAGLVAYLALTGTLRRSCVPGRRPVCTGRSGPGRCSVRTWRRG